MAPRPYLAQTLTGQWTSAPVNTGGSPGTTKFTCSAANFQSFMVGWQMIVNLEEPAQMTITEVTSSTEVKVKGDADAVAASDDFFLLSPPPGVNPQTGTLASIEGEDVTWYAWTSSGPSQYLWAHYRYMPPMLGFTDYNDSGNTVGAQSGANKSANTTATTESTTSTKAAGPAQTRHRYLSTICLSTPTATSPTAQTPVGCTALGCAVGGQRCFSTCLVG